MPFSKLGLSPVILDGVKAMGYVGSDAHPTPRHSAGACPARTSSAARRPAPARPPRSRLPILSKLGQHNPVGPRVLILEPTRELAAQVETAFRDYARFTDLKVTVVYRRRRLRQAERRIERRRGHRGRHARPLARSSRTGHAAARTRWNFSSSTKPTGCSTWVFCPTCAASWKNVRASATPRCSPPPFRRRSKRSSNGRCTVRRRLRSARAARPPRRSSTSSIPFPTRRKPTCCSNCSSA